MTVPHPSHSGRPSVTLRRITSIDGRTATHSGESLSLTSPESLNWMKNLRASHDAVIVGAGIVLAHDPDLLDVPATTAGKPLVRIVIDSHLRLPLTSRLVKTARKSPLWLATLKSTNTLRRQAYVDCGVIVLDAPGDSQGLLDISSLLSLFGQRGLSRVLLEGGPRLAASFLSAECVDAIEWCYTSRVIGGEGTPAVGPMGLSDLDDAPVFTRDSMHALGQDMVVRYSAVF